MPRVGFHEDRPVNAAGLKLPRFQRFSRFPPIQIVDVLHSPLYPFNVEDEIQQLADDIYRRKVLRARQLSVGERIDTAIELFEGAVGLMKDGIRAQFPGFTEDEVDATVKKRLNRIRQIDEHKIYQPASS